MSDYNIIEELEKLRIEHYDPGDWRLCPTHFDETLGGHHNCDCGADEHNARLDEIIRRVGFIQYPPYNDDET